LDQLESKKLTPYFKSLEKSEYDKESAPSFQIVGKDFMERIQVKGQDTFVKFYKDDCKICRDIAPVWDKFSHEVKSMDNLMIAEFDMQFNEVPGLKIDGIPTIILFVNGDVNNQIRYDQDHHNLGYYKSFLKKHSPVF